jgi:NAD(P) transhydrogenase
MTTILRYGVSSSTKSLWRRYCGLQSSFRCLSSSDAPKGIPYDKLTVGIPKEDFPLEKRVAATPESVERLVTPGFKVLVESDAGSNAYFSNADYESKGATIASKDEVWKKSDIILKVRRAT